MNEYQYWSNLEFNIDEVEQEIAKWKKMNHGCRPSEAKIQDEKLIELSSKLLNLERWRGLPPFAQNMEPQAGNPHPDYLNAAAPASDAMPASSSSVMSDAPCLSINNIPGIAPKNGAGKVAIEVAWKLECEHKERPTAAQVMLRLRELANEGKELTDVLRCTAGTVQGVNWITQSGKENNYSLKALRMTLKRWSKSRQ